VVLFNYSLKELTAKIVYYGPGLCGKTTNLHYIHEELPLRNKGRLLSLATETDRTLYFDFLPVEAGVFRGIKTRIQIYTVPGQVFYNATRRMVLKGADGVVFVADSQRKMMEPNLESLGNLRENLLAHGLDIEDIPLVMQYNKRDLPEVMGIEEMCERINTLNVPFYEAVATEGIGVEDTLKAISSLVLRSVMEKYGTKPGAGLPAEEPAVAVAGGGGYSSERWSTPESTGSGEDIDVDEANPIDELTSDGQFLSRNVFVEARHAQHGAFRQVGPVMAGIDRSASTYSVPDGALTDTGELLRRAGVREQDIEKMQRDGVVA